MKKTILICIGLVLGFFIFPSENVDAKELSEPTSYVCYVTSGIGGNYLLIECSTCRWVKSNGIVIGKSTCGEY